MITALYTITILELFLGGGGRLLEFGPITLRMVLFGLCLYSTAWLIIKRAAVDRRAIALAAIFIGFYLTIQLLSLLNGAASGASTEELLADVKPSLYWLVAPFFAVVLGSREAILRTATLARIAGLALATGYLLAISCLLSGMLDFNRFYEALDATGEFFFRGNTFFFYKGFLYIAIATVFFLAERGKLQKVAALLLASALALTLTRGFVIAAATAILMMLFSLRRWLMLSTAALLAVFAVFVIWIYLPEMSNDYSAQRDVSNNIRIEDFRFILANATLKTLLIGEGFGSYINERLNIENTYLWILWKTGLPGLLFWLAPLLLCTMYYRRIVHSGRDRRLAAAMYYSVVLIYVQTATNPFLNNPIGLSFVLIALFSLRTLTNSGSSGVRRFKPGFRSASRIPGVVTEIGDKPPVG